VTLSGLNEFRWQIQIIINQDCKIYIRQSRVRKEHRRRWNAMSSLILRDIAPK
jgi:hypothetical protein